MASGSNLSMTHPPRSNPPLRSSSGPPSPCITPSTETLVLVVSFMTSVPFSLGLSPVGRPSLAASHHNYERLRPDPTSPPGLLSRPVGADHIAQSRVLANPMVVDVL